MTSELRKDCRIEMFSAASETPTEEMISAGAHILRMASPAIVAGSPDALIEQIWHVMQQARPASRLSPTPETGLVDALRRLSFAAQTSGGTAGPDAALVAAIDEAERVLSNVLPDEV